MALSQKINPKEVELKIININLEKVFEINPKVLKVFVELSVLGLSRFYP